MLQTLLRLKSELKADLYNPLWERLSEDEWERIIQIICELDPFDLSAKNEMAYENGYEAGYDAGYTEAHQAFKASVDRAVDHLEDLKSGIF